MWFLQICLVINFDKHLPIVINPHLSILAIIVREMIFIKILEKQVGINLLCVGTIHNMFVDFYNCNLLKWFMMLWTIQKAINGTFVS